MHGYHRKCYQLFTLLSKATKRKLSSAVVDYELPSTSKRSRRSSAASFSVLFPIDKCLFCNKETIKVNNVKYTLVTCKTETAEASVKCGAQENGDEEMLCKVRDQDFRAREARYHNCCRREYTRSSTRHTGHKDSENNAFSSFAVTYKNTYWSRVN